MSNTLKRIIELVERQDIKISDHGYDELAEDGIFVRDVLLGIKESGKGAILIDDYLQILNKTGWQHTHIIQAPMSAQRFSAVVVSAMQKKRILGVTSRYVIILSQQ